MRHTQKATKKRPFKNPEACRLKALQLKAECNLNLHRFYNAKQIKVPQNLVDIDSQFSWIAKMRNVPESDLHSIDIKEGNKRVGWLCNICQTSGDDVDKRRHVRHVETIGHTDNIAIAYRVDRDTIGVAIKCDVEGCRAVIVGSDKKGIRRHYLSCHIDLVPPSDLPKAKRNPREPEIVYDNSTWIAGLAKPRAPVPEASAAWGLPSESVTAMDLDGMDDEAFLATLDELFPPVLLSPPAMEGCGEATPTTSQPWPATEQVVGDNILSPSDVDIFSRLLYDWQPEFFHLSAPDLAYFKEITSSVC